MEFDNQIVPASVAGGVGATLTSAGETRHSGVEATARLSFREMGVMQADDIYVRTALTWVSLADPEASNVVVFVIMAIVLMIRPAGLFGKEA